MEDLIYTIARDIARAVEAAAVLIVALGSAEALIQLAIVLGHRGGSHGERKVVWQ